MDMAVCRRVADCPEFAETMLPCRCNSCLEPSLVEKGLENDHVLLCIHCANQVWTNHVIFVELPPDEFGHSSMAKTVGEVFAAKDGEWHKTGVWHNQKTVLERMD